MARAASAFIMALRCCGLCPQRGCPPHRDYPDGRTAATIRAGRRPFHTGLQNDQAPVLPAGIAREREMHIVVAPNRVQVERLAPVRKRSPRG